MHVADKNMFGRVTCTMMHLGRSKRFVVSGLNRLSDLSNELFPCWRVSAYLKESQSSPPPIVSLLLFLSRLCQIICYCLVIFERKRSQNLKGGRNLGLNQFVSLIMRIFLECVSYRKRKKFLLLSGNEVEF